MILSNSPHVKLSKKPSTQYKSKRRAIKPSSFVHQIVSGESCEFVIYQKKIACVSVSVCVHKKKTHKNHIRKKY